MAVLKKKDKLLLMHRSAHGTDFLNSAGSDWCKGGKLLDSSGRILPRE